MNTDVVVVGAGPVGLMLAGELRLGGVEVAVYDRLAVPTDESRALGFNRRTAESLDQRGLLERLGEIRWGAIGHFGGVRFDLDLLPDDHRGVLGLSQVRTERVLGRWAAELGVAVHRDRRVVGLRETGDGVTVTVEGPAGRTEVAARYLVGCDGAGSTVAGLAGIPVAGRESTRGMYTAEIAGATLRPRPAGERLPGGNMVVCTPVGEGRHRIVIHDRALPAHPDPGALTFAEVADAWQRLTGESVHDARPLWLWARGNQAGLAGCYRRGRVLLAGDAAHDLPPLAAWGLSAGLQDAVNLSWKLAATVGGRAPDTLLDSYHDERHPVGQRLLRDVAAASEIYLGAAEMDPVRSVLGELLADADAAGQLAGIVSGLGIRYEVGPGGHPGLGRRVDPGLVLSVADGSRVRVGELLRGARGLLVTCRADELDPAVKGWGDRVDVVALGEAPVPDPLTHSLLVRPDGYAAWTDPGSELPLTDALTRWFGPADATTGAQS